MGRKLLYGGGYKEISKYPLELKRKKYLLSYNDLYHLCVNKQNSQIEKEIIEIEEKIRYLESKGNDVEIVWKVCSTFLAILIPISAFISFDTIEKLVEIDNNILKLLFIGGVILAYLFFVLLFVSFINIQNVKLYNYNLYKRVLVELHKTKDKEKKRKKHNTDIEKRKTEKFVHDIIYYPEKYDLHFGKRVSIDEFAFIVRTAGYKLTFEILLEIVINTPGLSLSPAQTYIIIDRYKINMEIRNK